MVEFISLKLPFVWQNIHFAAQIVLHGQMTSCYYYLVKSIVISLTDGANYTLCERTHCEIQEHHCVLCIVYVKLRFRFVLIIFRSSLSSR